MKIGIFGGTFNPVHQGHVHLAQQCVEELKLDKLLVIPTKQPPHKQAQELASGEHRAQMCRLAFAEIPQAQVSEMELHREGKSYTADTLTQLKQQFPQAQFYLIVGGDMFLTFHQWNRFEEILQGAALCAACRSQDELPKLQQAKGSFVFCIFIAVPPHCAFSIALFFFFFQYDFTSEDIHCIILFIRGVIV